MIDNGYENHMVLPDYYEHECECDCEDEGGFCDVCTGCKECDTCSCDDDNDGGLYDDE